MKAKKKSKIKPRLINYDRAEIISIPDMYLWMSDSVKKNVVAQAELDANTLLKHLIDEIGKYLEEHQISIDTFAKKTKIDKQHFDDLMVCKVELRVMDLSLLCWALELDPILLIRQ